MYLDYYVYFLYVLITLSIIYSIIKNPAYMNKNKKQLALIIIVILVYTQYRRYGSRLFTGTFSYSYSSLPVHFCRFSTLMTLLYFLTKNKIVKGFVYFQTGLGFLSVLLPGAELFTMTHNWRNISFMADHTILSFMPVYLILLDDYEVNIRDFIISLVYSIGVPLALLPISIKNNYNAYYSLDAVFAKDILDNPSQKVITIIFVILVIIYHILMWYLGKYLHRLKLRQKDEVHFFKPIKWWVITFSYFIIGLVLCIVFVRPVPSYLKDVPDAYLARPYKTIHEHFVIYETVKGDNIIYYVEGLTTKDFTIYNYEDSKIAETVGTKYKDYLKINSKDVTSNYIQIQITKDKGKYNESYVIYLVKINKDYQEFINKYQDKLIYN